MERNKERRKEGRKEIVTALMDALAASFKSGPQSQNVRKSLLALLLFKEVRRTSVLQWKVYSTSNHSHRKQRLWK